MAEGKEIQPTTGPDQICILPYAGLHEAFTIGVFHFWPWHSEQSKHRYVPDEERRRRISLEVERHVNWFGKPMKTQCLVSFEENGTLHLASGAEAGLGVALTFLAFAHLLPLATSTPPVPETFQMFSAPLRDEGHLYGIMSEGLHNLTHAISADSVKALRFQAPREVDGLTMEQRRLACRFQPVVETMCEGIDRIPPDDETLSIGAALLGNADQPGSRRALRAVRWHNLAMRQDESLDPGQRPVALATAFEILFDLGRSYSKAKRVCEKVDSLLSDPKTRRFRVLNEKGTKTLYKVTRQSYVVHKLFRWRNRVVHGDEYGVRDFTLRLRGWHRKNILLIASRIFGRCLKALYLQKE